ncbi:B and T lymphocyte associated [Pitangus sulphuratus]|nr:B and T lymphocyte associated [Pitangus sulphuratus]
MGSTQQPPTAGICVMFVFPGSDEAGGCSAEIHVPSRSQYKAHVGGSLSLECPVRYCQTKPLLQWCRMEGATCVQLERGQAGWKSDSVFALEISPVHRNDTGRFRCQAKGVNFSIESHEIKIIVEEKSVNITVSPETKQKRTPLAQQRQESLVRSPAAAPSPGAGTAQASEQSPSLYCPMASPPQALKDNAIYDNDVPPWNAQRRALALPCSFPGVPSIPVLPESPDALTYAALNHSAPAERWQRRERAPVNEVTEYASINVHR